MIVLLVLVALLSPLASCSSAPVLDLAQGQRYNEAQGLSILKEPRLDFRLPDALKPLEYEITIIPYLTEPEDRAFTFDGTVRILFEVVKGTGMVVFHTYNLTVHEASVRVTGEAEDRPLSGSWPSNDDRQFYTVSLRSQLFTGDRAYLTANFTGWLKDDLFGFYRSSYLDAQGNPKWMATTFFEASGARRAFPCWDEPAWRANFTLHIAHPPGFTAIANMPQDGEDTPLDPTEYPELEGWSMTHFEPSVSMPTYLVAYAVSDFEYKEHPTRSNYRVWARPGAVDQADEGNILAPKIVDFMAEYTGHEYSLPKMDQIALPDFVAGAMENWGLITYRETALLYEEGVSTAANLQRVENVVTHELAHQWFGNLVSPKWWDSIWLNEGFASYFGYRALRAVETEWQLEEQFIYEQTYPGMQNDGLEAAHPLVDAVENTNAYNPVFDGLAYTKGGSIVRFLINLMGEDNFKAGIFTYLSESAFGNANSDDLWKGLEPSLPEGLLPVGASLTDVMKPWMRQAGFPVIIVNRTYHDVNFEAVITQERFVAERTGAVPLEEVWDVPLTMTSQYDTDFEDLTVRTWHRGEPLTVPLQASADQWVMLNVQQVGFYRVHYDLQNWQLLVNALHNPAALDQIHVINRAQMIDDAHALSRAQYLPYETALELTNYLSTETQFLPWAAALSANVFLYDRLSNESYSKGLSEWFVLDKMAAVYEDVGGVSVNQDDAHMMRIKRNLVLRWACQLGHVTCNQDSMELFAQWQQEPFPGQVNPIAPDLKAVVYCAGMRGGAQPEYDFLFEQYQAASHVASEQANLLAALACANDTTLLLDLLNKSITPGSGIRTQDAKGVFISVYNNPAGVQMALDFLIAFYQPAAEAYGGLGSVGGLFLGLSSKLNTQEQRDKIQQFRTTNEGNLGDALPGIDGGLALLDQLLAWQVRHRLEVIAFLAEKRGDSASSVLRVSTTLIAAALVLCRTILL